MELELKGKNNPKIISPNGETLKFALSEKNLSDPDVFSFFIKATEKCVRTDPRYDNFVAYLKSQGYTKDVLQSGIDSNKFKKTKVEFHHGPIFNLFDICAIVCDHMLDAGEKVTTFSVAREVLNAHEDGLIQVTMLAETNHQLIHDGQMFVHMKQTIGDLIGFIKRYKNGFHKEHLYKLQSYFKLCEEYDATDNDYLVIRTAADKIYHYLSSEE